MPRNLYHLICFYISFYTSFLYFEETNLKLKLERFRANINNAPFQLS